jgi:NADPH-dependent 2,4-dienoyl-CoA reductase/sulfur reductase-like enzyme
MTLKSADILVIGGGPAGLASAIKAKESGIDDVVLVERAEQLGGLLHQCIHNGFGSIYFKEDLTGPEYARRFIEKTRDLHVKVLLETMVLRVTPDKKVTLCNTDGLSPVEAKTVILAMGCRERTREAILVPGTRPAGVLTAGTAQRIVNVEGYLPGKDIVILGSGDIGMIMARRLTLEGAKVKAVVEILPYIGGLIRNEVQCLHDFDIPVFLEHTVTWIHGKQRVEAVTIARVDGERNPIPGTERTIECDTLLVSVGLIPENELSLNAGIKLDPVTGGPIVSEVLETNVPGIFVSGNVLHVNDLVDNVSLEGELAGQSAAEYVRRGSYLTKQKVSLKAGENIRYIVPQYISGEKEVTINMRTREPDVNCTIQVGDILQKSFRVVRPGEMITIKLSPEQLSRIRKGTDELLVSCKKKESSNDREE